jgi:S-(hydroxymethyl)glutathione dehydrogenase/alcohol dehydrogenase
VCRDIPRLVSLAEPGKLDLGLMVSTRIRIEEVNTAIAVLDGGEVIRSVIVF